MLCIKNIKYFLIILLLSLFACTTKDSQYSILEVENTLDSLKKIYAPDSRTAWWNISIDNKEKFIRVNAETDNPQADSNIIETLSNTFPQIKVTTKLLPETNRNQLVTGLINNSVANLRSNPWHSAEIATQALLGTPIKILKRDKGWYLIQIPNNYIAWTDAPNVVRINKDELNYYKKSNKIVYNKQYGFSYSLPNVNSQVVSDLAIGCILPVTGVENGYYKVQYPDKRIAYVKQNEVIDANIFFNKTIDETELVKTAKKFNGIPYLWGGTSSKAIDCSGFTSTIYYLNGIILQRDASQQVKYGKIISTNFNYTNLLPGDLLFFGRKANDSLPEKITHVAMYIGDSEFIHASGRVRISSMDSTRENFASDYISRFVKTERINGVYNINGVQRIINNRFYKKILNF
ncbi:MAG: C40 family peptidase [Chlorobi bacterium]|nr:C40 family peptidase [Chlorobiota bacterium]